MRALPPHQDWTGQARCLPPPTAGGGAWYSCGPLYSAFLSPWRQRLLQTLLVNPSWQASTALQSLPWSQCTREERLGLSSVGFLGNGGGGGVGRSGGAVALGVK